MAQTTVNLRPVAINPGSTQLPASLTQDGLPVAVAANQVNWTAVPTLQASWANVAGFQAAEYRRTAAGVVELRGQIDSGTKTAGTTLFTLPAGSRPAAKQTFPVFSDVTAGAAGALVIATTGVVTIGTVDLTAASSLSLSGISFDTA